MTDDEYNILDELYFVQSYAEIQRLSGYTEEALLLTLRALKAHGWIKFLKGVDDEWPSDELSDDQLKTSFFLATKNGLMAHNS